MKKQNATRDYVEIGMLCAMAIILDTFVRIPIGITGGSINIATVPLYVISLRHGWYKGLIGGGIVFGLITCLIDGHGFITYPLEYFIAFGACCLIGIFARYINKVFKEGPKIISAYALIIGSMVVATMIRILAATLDSMFIYAYEFIPAITYNISYILPSSIAVAIIICLLMPMINMLNKRYVTIFLSKDNKEEEKKDV